MMTGWSTLSIPSNGHLRDVMVEKLQKIGRGHQVGTIGTNRGMYLAHLHFEIRKNINVGLVQSRYAKDFSNYFSPTHFIEDHRSLRKEFRFQSIPIDTFGTGVSNRMIGEALKPFPKPIRDRPPPNFSRQPRPRSVSERDPCSERIRRKIPIGHCYCGCKPHIKFATFLLHQNANARLRFLVTSSSAKKQPGQNAQRFGRFGLSFAKRFVRRAKVLRSRRFSQNSILLISQGLHWDPISPKTQSRLLKIKS